MRGTLLCNLLSSKGWALPKRELAFALGSWVRFSQMLGCPPFVYHIEESNNMKSVGILSSMISVQPSQSFDTKVGNTDGSTMYMWPDKTSGHCGLVKLPGMAYTQHIVTHHGWQELTLILTSLREDAGSSGSETPWNEPLPLADFNLYPFVLINHSHE